MGEACVVANPDSTLITGIGELVTNDGDQGAYAAMFNSDAIALGLSIGLCNLAASLPGAVFAWPLLGASGTQATRPLAGPSEMD